MTPEYTLIHTKEMLPFTKTFLEERKKQRNKKKPRNRENIQKFRQAVTRAQVGIGLSLRL